jgi:hypothetical protein
MTSGGKPTEPRSWRRLPPRRVLWVALPLVVLVYVAGSSPSVAQRAPRLLFPALGAAGAVLVTVAFVNSLVRLVRRYREERRTHVGPVVLNLILFVVLVIMPLTHLQRALTPSLDGAPRILAGFGDRFGSEGYPRVSPPRGLDIADRPGADVLAAA